MVTKTLFTTATCRGVVVMVVSASTPSSPTAGCLQVFRYSDNIAISITGLLAGMMQELRQWPQQELHDPAEPAADPHFQWDRLRLLSETNFKVPGNGRIQRIASSLFAKLPLLTVRDQYETRFILQVTSLWPDLTNEDRAWVFQRLNVYCIVAALGWLAATASSTTTTDFVLPPGLVIPHPEAPRQCNRRNNREQPGAVAAPATAAEQLRGSEIIETREEEAESTTVAETSPSLSTMLLPI